MGFMTLTIKPPAELHVRKGQLRHPKAETTQIALEYLTALSAALMFCLMSGLRFKQSII